MRLREYLDKNNEKPYRFARRSRVRPATVYALYNEENGLNLTRDTMRKIIVATGGKVSLDDLA